MIPLQPPRTPPGMKTADFANEQAYQAYLNALFHLLNVVIRIKGRHFKNSMWSKFQSDHIRILLDAEFLVQFFSRSQVVKIFSWKHHYLSENITFFTQSLFLNKKSNLMTCITTWEWENESKRKILRLKLFMKVVKMAATWTLI